MFKIFWRRVRVKALGGPRRDYERHKEAARQLVLERIAHFNSHYNFSFGRVAIRNQSSRWGSCSVKRNLNFNYRIVELAPELQDYLVVHELCHLAVMNHSRKFWNLVAETIPNYAACRRTLRQWRRT